MSKIESLVVDEQDCARGNGGVTTAVTSVESDCAKGVAVAASAVTETENISSDVQVRALTRQDAPRSVLVLSE